MKLYSYYNSTASYRVRIALGLKGLAPELGFVNLLRGEQRGAQYEAVNPQGLLPALIDEGHTLTQSIAIMEYLEEAHPKRPILPKDIFERAHVRALALAVACEIAPLGNLRVRTYLHEKMGKSKDEQFDWARHWIDAGLPAVEKTLAQSHYTGRYCHGDAPTMADCCLIPQWFNAQRFGCDLAQYPTIARIAQVCAEHPAFAAAHPDRQPDAPKA